MHYKCFRSEARRYLPEREATGEPPEWLCHKVIAGNISELIEMTTMVVLQLWCFIFISKIMTIKYGNTKNQFYSNKRTHVFTRWTEKTGLGYNFSFYFFKNKNKKSRCLVVFPWRIFILIKPMYNYFYAWISVHKSSKNRDKTKIVMPLW